MLNKRSRLYGRNRIGRGFTLVELLIVIAIIGIVVTIFIGGKTDSIFSVTDPETAIATLQNQGFKNIRITGFEPFACAEDDDYSTGFVAINSNGYRVEGVVCSSFWGKYSTIRYK